MCERECVNVLRSEDDDACAKCGEHGRERAVCVSVDVSVDADGGVATPRVALLLLSRAWRRGAVDSAC